MLIVLRRCEILQQTCGIDHPLCLSDDRGIDPSALDKNGPASPPGSDGNDLLGPFDFLLIRAPIEPLTLFPTGSIWIEIVACWG